MTARIVLDLEVEGDGETEQSLRDHCAYFRDRKYEPEYHEIVAHLALMLARKSWVEADRLRHLREQGEARRARLAARQAAKREGDQA